MFLLARYRKTPTRWSKSFQRKSSALCKTSKSSFLQNKHGGNMLSCLGYRGLSWCQIGEITTSSSPTVWKSNCFWQPVKKLLFGQRWTVLSTVAEDVALTKKNQSVLMKSGSMIYRNPQRTPYILEHDASASTCTRNSLKTHDKNASVSGLMFHLELWSTIACISTFNDTVNAEIFVGD